MLKMFWFLGFVIKLKKSQSGEFGVVENTGNLNTV